MMVNGMGSEAAPHLLLTRCAWCARYDAGDTWLDASAVQTFLRSHEAEPVSHGICPECLADLQQRGLSR